MRRFRIELGLFLLYVALIAFPGKRRWMKYGHVLCFMRAHNLIESEVERRKKK